MTLALYYFFELFFKEFLDNFLFYATKFSALIISISLYLLYRKLGALKRLFLESPKEKSVSPFLLTLPLAPMEAVRIEARAQRWAWVWG